MARRPKGSGSIFKVEGGWRGYRTVLGHREYTSVLLTKREVLAELGQLAKPKPKAGTPTVSDFCKHLLETDWRSSHFKETHWATYETHWRTRLAISALGAMQLDMVTTRDVQEFLDEQRRIENGKPLMPNTLKRIGSLVSAVFRDAGRARYGYVTSNPAAGAQYPRSRQKKRPQVTPHQLRGLPGFGDGMYADMILLMRDTGLSRSEVCALKPKDIRTDDEGRSYVRIDKGIVIVKGGVKEEDSPKTTNRVRELPLTAEAAEVLRRQPKRGEYIFARDDRRPVRPDTLSKKFMAMAKAAGFEGLTLHHLRGIYISVMLEAGVDVRTVQELAGHASSKTTVETYARSRSDVKDAAAKAFSKKLAESG